MQRMADVATAELRWRQPSAMRQQYELDTGDTLVATLNFRSGWFKLGATLAIEPQARALADLPWLALFGWFVIVMMYRDAVTTAVT